MTPEMKIKALIHNYEFELEDRKKELAALISEDVTSLFFVAVIKIDIQWIEKILSELKH